MHIYYRIRIYPSFVFHFQPRYLYRIIYLVVNVSTALVIKFSGRLHFSLLRASATAVTSRYPAINVRYEHSSRE